MARPRRTSDAAKRFGAESILLPWEVPKAPVVPKGKFKSLPKTEQLRRITAAEAAGRLTPDKAAAARRFWQLPQTPPPGPRRPILSGGRFAMVPAAKITPQQARAEERIARANQQVRAANVWAPPPDRRKAIERAKQTGVMPRPQDLLSYRQRLAAGVTEERAKQLRREDVLPKGRSAADLAKRRDYWDVSPGAWVDAVKDLPSNLRETLSNLNERVISPAVEDMESDIAWVGKQAGRLLTEEERDELAEYWRETQATSMQGAEAVRAAVSGRMRKNLSPPLEAEMSAIGVDPNIARRAVNVVSNLIGNLSGGAVGFPVGVAAIAAQPRTMGGEVAQFYADFYEPLLKGDLDQFGRNIEKDPDMLLDWLGAMGVVFGGARRVGTATRAARFTDERAGGTAATRFARGLVSGKEPAVRVGRSGEERVTWGKPVVTRGYKVREGRLGSTRMVDTGVQRLVPGAASGVFLTDSWDAIRRNLLPSGGRRAFRKGVREEIEADRARLFGEIEAFRAQGSQIDKDPVLSLAFDRWAVHGGDAGEARLSVLQEINRRTTDPHLREVTPEIGLENLRRAAQVLEDPPAALVESVNRARQIMPKVQETLIGAGLLREGTAERMLMMPARFLEDVPAIDTPKRTAIEDVLNLAMDERAAQLGKDVDELQYETTLSMEWLDANAVAWGRREQRPPEEFYDEFYEEAVLYDPEDLTALMGSDESDTLFQAGVGYEPARFEISEKKAREHVRAHIELAPEELIAQVDDPELRARLEAVPAETKAAAEARATPKFREWAGKLQTSIGQVASTVQRRDRITDYIPDQAERAEFAAWYTNIWEEFGRYFGDDVSRAVRAFLISQAAMSPADGVTALLKALEYRHRYQRWPDKGILSHKTQEIINAWDNIHLGQDPYGIQTKISDFFNSAEQSNTRTYLRGVSLTGPGVVDRWSLRSVGYLDHKTYSELVRQGIDAPNPEIYKALARDIQKLEDAAEKRQLSRKEQRTLDDLIARHDREKAVVDEFYDMGGAPDAYQYEWTSYRLDELRRLMNEEGFDGRTDWRADEVQALDWFATRREWGEVSGGWDDTWGRNQMTVVGELATALPRGAVLDAVEASAVEAGMLPDALSVSSAGTHVVITGTAIRDMKLPKAHLRELGVSTRGLSVNRDGKAILPGSADLLAKHLADTSGRRAYTFYEGGLEASGTRRVGIDLSGNVFEALSLAEKKGLVTDILEKGAVILPMGDGRLRLVFADREGKAIKGLARKQRDALLSELQAIPDVEATPFFATMKAHAPRANPSFDLYRRDDPRGVLARAAGAWRRRTDFRVAPVSSLAQAEGFVDAISRNSRAWSIAPRAADDFISGGYRGFLTDDGNAGAAVSPDGEIVSVFNSGSFPGAGSHALVMALAEGGYWLNAFDGHLPAYYKELGFREVARLAFDERYAPDMWDYTDGRPDVVFMAYAPHLPERPTTRYTSPEEAVRRARNVGRRGLQQRSVDSILEELANRGDGMPYERDGRTLAQWKRPVTISREDPVALGAVRLSDDGVELMVTRNSNFSTLVHENAHAMLKGTLLWLRDSGDPRFSTVMQRFGIKDIEKPISVKAQELFARTVEAHAFMGRMPAPQLRRLTERGSAAMVTIHRGLKQIDPENHEEIKALLKDPDVSSLLNDLIDVTYGAQRRPDAIFMPRLGPTAPSILQGIRRKLPGVGPAASITPPRTSPVGKGSKFIRHETMEHRMGPQVAAQYASAVERRMFQQQVAENIYRSDLTRPLERDPTTGRYMIDVEGGYVPYVYGRVPGALRMLDEELAKHELEADFFDREPQEIADKLQEQVGTLLQSDEVFPTDISHLDDVTIEDLVESRQIVQIPRFLRDDYVDALTGSSMQGKVFQLLERESGLLGAAVKGLGVINALQRWNMVMKVAYGATNTIGAMATATAHNPLWVGEIKKGVDVLSSWQPSTLRILDEMVGSGQYELTEILNENTRGLGRVRRAEQAGFTAITKTLTWPERRIRRMVMARQLKMMGYGDEDLFLGLVDRARTDPEARALFNQIGRLGEDAVIRFRGQNAVEKMIIRRAAFVYGWLRASLRYTARFPLEHPILAAVMNRIGQEGWDVLQDQLERTIGFRGGIVQKMWDEGGERMAKMIDLSSILPFASGMETMRALSSPLFTLADVGKPGADVPADLFSQGTILGFTLAVGEAPGGRSWERVIEGYTKAGGFAQIPLANLLYRISDPASTERATLGPMTRNEVLAQFLIGQLVPRNTKLDAAQESYMRRMPIHISAPARVQQDIDVHMERYAAAVELRGDYENVEWTRALNARASYELSTSLKNREWNALPEEEREVERAVMKAKVLKAYFPDAYANVISRRGNAVTEESIEAIESEYSEWVSTPYSDMRSYIRDQLGEEAVP